jgi:hypothetical protein
VPKHYVLAEEFRTPLSFCLEPRLPTTIDLYYRVHRYGTDIANDAEFTRGIYLEHYPLGRIEV